MALPVGSAPRSPSTSPHAESSRAAAVTAAAKPALSTAASSSTGAPLLTVPTWFDFNNFYLQKADQHFRANEFEKADGFYRAALITFNSVKEDPQEDFIELSNIPAACYIGLAKTCEPAEKAKNIELAREALDEAYNNRSKWDGLDSEKKSFLYNGLKINLENFWPLIDSADREAIYVMIDECKQHIPPLYAATYALQKAQELFKQDNFTEAAKWYSEAADVASHENLGIIEYHAIIASSFIGIIATTQQSDADGKCDNNLYLAAYKEIACLYTEIKRQPSKNGYEHILHLSTELLKLTPDTSNCLPSLRLIIDDCQKELELLKNPAHENQASLRGSGSAPRQPQSYFEIFAAFVLGGFAALAGAWLYGRLITKID